jgi:hypothetical protein
MIKSQMNNQIFKDSANQPNGTLEKTERELIVETLKRHNWNRIRTAKELGITIKNLRNKITKYRSLGISVPKSMHAGARGRAFKQAFSEYVEIISHEDKPAIDRFWSWLVDREKKQYRIYYANKKAKLEKQKI